MKKLFILSGALIVAACSGTEDAEPAAEVEVEVAAEAGDASTWATAEEAAGDYTLAYTDGTEGTLTLSGDGAASGIIGGEEFTANFTVPEPGKLCYTDLSNEDLSVPPQCWVNSSANEDGSWGFTGDDGTTGTAARAE